MPEALMVSDYIAAAMGRDMQIMMMMMMTMMTMMTMKMMKMMKMMMTMMTMIIVDGSNMLVQTRVTSAWRRPKVAFLHPMIYKPSSQEGPEDQNDDGHGHVHDNEGDARGDYESDGLRNLRLLQSSHDLQITVMILPSGI